MASGDPGEVQVGSMLRGMSPSPLSIIQSGCTVNKNREQLCPAWLSCLLGGVVVATLVAAYPRADVHTRSLSTQKASMISVAYLEAWLLVEPDSPEYLESLAMQYLELGRWDTA